MIPIDRHINRRKLLRGMVGGAAVGVGLPFLDCFLNEAGTATAAGAPLPVCFGTWFQGLGFNPGLWEPKIVGPNYEMNTMLKALTPFKDKINIYSGMKCYLDGKPLQTHTTGWQVGTTGGIPNGNTYAPSVDSLVADVIGTRTRFRSLEVACDGIPTSSYSRRSGSAVNPSEISPVALYARIFGPEFKDPNAAEFTPDPTVMARRSVLSFVSDDRARVMKRLGASDRARLDEYFTALREVEQQLDLELQKPAPLAACSIPDKVEEGTPGTVIDDTLKNAKLFGTLLAHALACGQTRVINVVFSSAQSSLRHAGSTMTYHMYTHEEPIDEKLGYQAEVTKLQFQIIDGFASMLKALDSVREGDRTLFDRIVLLYQTDHSYARTHTIDNMPIITAGSAGNRIKTGIHVAANGDPVTRVGLTMQQALGVPTSSWGEMSNQTSKTISEVLA